MQTSFVLCVRKIPLYGAKTASLMGLGEAAVVCVDTHNDGTINTDAMADTLNQLKAEGLIPLRWSVQQVLLITVQLMI